MGIEFQEMLRSYGIKSKPTTVKNPTANAIVKRIHGTLGEQLQATFFDANWSNNVGTLIQLCAFALHAASPAQGTYLPAQLAFGYDLIFWQKVLFNWKQIKSYQASNCKQHKREQEKI
jgi:hypothetical protein